MRATAKLWRIAGRSMVATVAWLTLSTLALAEDCPLDRPEILELEPNVEKLVGEGSRALHLGDPVDFGDEIRTGPNAWVAICLGDNGLLDIGSDTTAVLRGPGDMKVDLSRGRLIVALARAFRGILWVNAPSVALGIRGTLAEVQVLYDGTTRLWVYEGEVDLKLKGGDMTTVPEGSQILVKPDGTALTPSPISPWGATTLQQDPRDAAPGDSPLIDQVQPRLFIRE